MLHHLQQAGPLSQQELGSALRINPSNLVGLLDALEADGLIVRPRDPADRRRHLVELTADGQRRLAEAKRAVAAAEQDLLAPLTEAERVQLHGVLERLASHTCAAPAARRALNGARGAETADRARSTGAGCSASSAPTGCGLGRSSS